MLDYAEGQAVRYTSLDTGNFTFSINKYKSSATYITNRMKQDSFYMSRLVSSFVPKQHRAIAKAMEIDVLALPNAGQTTANPNVINTGAHRFIASGTNAVLVPQDFAKAKFALQKANVPMTNLVAIVDSSVEYQLSTMTNLTAVAYNPKWEGIVRDGASTGIKFLFNVYGFDVYTSQNLPNGINESITAYGSAKTISDSSGVANYFFSAAPDVLPFVGSIRQPPKVDSDYNKDLQREEYVTTCRYGFKLFRPENIVTVISDASQIV